MRSLVVLFCFLAHLAHAQEFKSGIHFGMTATQVDGDQLRGFDKAGLLAGLFVEWDITPRIKWYFELMYVQKGSRKPLDKEDNSYYRMRLNYLEVPILFRYKAGKKIAVQGGPAFGVLVFAQENDQLGEIRYAPPFRKMEYSFNSGLTYELSEKVMVDIRYSFSVVPVRPFDASQLYPYWDRGQFNSVVQLALQYSF